MYIHLIWAMKRQYPNVKLDASLTNYKKAVLAYLAAKFEISEEKIIQAQKGLKMHIEDLYIINHYN